MANSSTITTNAITGVGLGYTGNYSVVAAPAITGSGAGFNGGIYQLSLHEGLTLHDAETLNTSMAMAFSELLNLHDAQTSNRVTFIALGESLTLQDALASNAHIGLALAESLVLHDTLSTNAPLLAYVVNANAPAMTTYQNFNFNSFAKLNGKYYGAADDGIYELTGDTDNGVQISSTVTMGKQDFESPVLKNMPSVYLGVQTSGALILKVVTDVGGARFYQLRPNANPNMQNSRLKLGRGTASRYWQFELTNVSGADFTLESISFHVITLGRQIRER